MITKGSFDNLPYLHPRIIIHLLGLCARTRPTIRPWLVDSLGGGSTDGMGNPPIGKKLGAHFFIWPPDRLQVPNIGGKLRLTEFFFFY